MKTRITLFVLFLLVFKVCCAADSIRGDTTRIAFDKCFSNIHHSDFARALGCHNTFYKLIGKKYVLSIKLDTLPQTGSCITAQGPRTIQYFMAALSVYKDSKANLNNICTDVTTVNSARPVRKIVSKTGEIVIGVSSKTDYYGEAADVVSIMVKRLIFYDKENNKKIEIKNEMFWKVVNVLNKQG
ncbi:hypothetical protein [Hymenobacter sp. YC55]|uniref:hypothetical protein n=1 Tax=Hymenobacter sp. YC55 TaxID=3034019 RepID=UPI0023F817FF|nr:hypothetical protein [Hymenobacter sp. YC55]MDF7810445.1 hypothetical protein [Hymenobacter sp. YC55]